MFSSQNITSFNCRKYKCYCLIFRTNCLIRRFKTGPIVGVKNMYVINSNTRQNVIGTIREGQSAGALRYRGSPKSLYGGVLTEVDFDGQRGEVGACGL